MMEKPRYNEGISAHRIEALTDGIFAFAMTLLVLSINLPLSASALSGMSVTQTLLAQADRFVNYAMSFVLLAIFWISHHRVFDHLKAVDWNLVWANVFLLLFIALMPFSTALMNEFSNDSGSDFMFGLNLFVIGSTYYAIWAYATEGRRLIKPSVDDLHIKKINQGMLVVPVISFIAMFFAIVYQPLSPLVYLAIPIIIWLPRKLKI